MSPARRVAIAFLLAVTPPLAARAQAPVDLVELGVRAYQDLELEGATRYLRRALSTGGAQTLPAAERAKALMYLVAVEWLQQRPDSARSAARSLVMLAPRYRPDQLVFPPEVQNLVVLARREHKVVAVRTNGAVRIRPGSDTFTVALFASSVHDVAVTLTAGDGALFRTLYTGPVADSLDVHWDGFNAAGGATPAGNYALLVTSRDERGRAIRTVRLPLEVDVERDEPAAPTTPPAVRAPGAWDPAIRAAVPAALVAATIVVLPRFVAPGEQASDARFVVGTTVALGGIAAFLLLRPGREPPAATAPRTAVTVRPRAVVRLTIRPGESVITEARRE